jgi:hypothetical protein
LNAGTKVREARSVRAVRQVELIGRALTAGCDLVPDGEDDDQAQVPRAAHGGSQRCQVTSAVLGTAMLRIQAGLADLKPYCVGAPSVPRGLQLLRAVLRDSPGDEQGVAVVDIWRLVDGQIVEHWDVVQPVPDAAQIPNGMF